MARILVIGAGDVGRRIAMGLADSGRVREIILAGLSQGLGPGIAGSIESCHDCHASFEPLDGTRQSDVEALLRRGPWDLLIQSGSLLSPWALGTRHDPLAKAVAAAGLGIQLPMQLPILTTVMRAVREIGYENPVANISFPDVTHDILQRVGLAPTIGLGNVSMMHQRVRASLRRRMRTNGDGASELPLIRVLGHHSQVYHVLKSAPPDDPAARCRVWLGEAGQNADELAYLGFPMPPGVGYNEIAAAASLPVLLALLPGAMPLRFSAPAPNGLPGGYPVRIADGVPMLDLPDGVLLTEAVAFNRRMARIDGIEDITADGTVTYTEAARRAVAGVAPELAEPLPLTSAEARAQRLLALLGV